jgi:enterochelin esterase-like enzyme
MAARRNPGARSGFDGPLDRAARRLRASRPLVLGGVAVAATVAALVVLGAMDASNTTLQIMGFDPDRAQLITALMIGAIAAAVSALIDGRVARAAVWGLVWSAALFGGTFVAETGTALGATGATGAFDPGGWLITVVTLLMSGLVAGWAGGMLAYGARPAITTTALTIAALIRRRRVERRAAYRAVAIVMVAVMLFATVPVFGDLVNFSPDARMIHGAPALAGLGAPASVPTLPPATGSGSDPTAGFQSSPTPGASPSATNAPTLAERPWLAWLPSGSGRVTPVTMTAPWKGGPREAGLMIYTPPGYDAASGRRYPVVYETPSPYSLWDGATNVKVALDTLIGSGEIPPAIVVFISSAGSPWPESQCANSFDGRQWFDTYVGQTVVGWVDTHYRTIVSAAARAVMGMSEGGYCAAILALHHPGVFGTSIAFSGYYHAGLGGAGSAAPFGTSTAALETASPDVVAGRLTPSQRANLFFVLIADPKQPLYGPQAADFYRLLSADGYPAVAMEAAVPHGWVQVRQNTPAALQAWSARLVATGVFGA